MRLVLIILPMIFLAGCAQRTVDITSAPSGALVYLNGEEIGRTPLRYDFTWYSNYEVTLRKDGWETLKTSKKIDPPLLFIPPIDLLGELVGARDHRHWNFVMELPDPAAGDAGNLIARGESMKKDLRSSSQTHPPTTFPTTRAMTRPSTMPTTTTSPTTRE